MRRPTLAAFFVNGEAVERVCAFLINEVDQV